MIGMDEEGEEAESEEDAPATQQPRNALQALINGFLGQVLILTMLLVMKRACHIWFVEQTLHMPPHCGHERQGPQWDFACNVW